MEADRLQWAPLSTGATDGARVAQLGDLEPKPSVVSIGFFDGVHRGHQRIIERAVSQAARLRVRSVVTTFDRHPMEVVQPGSQPKLLMTLRRRLTTLAQQGVDAVVVLAFDDELRHLDSDAFVQHVLLDPLQAVGVVVGSNFRFGHKAKGDVALLTQLGAVHDFTVDGVDLLEEQGQVISSTEIRGCLDDGDVARAARLLGRPHLIDGVVVRGDQRGASLGFPTANLQLDPRVAVPAPGVYATMLYHPDGRALPSATSVGTNPTFGGQELRVEAYCLGIDEDLYGLEVGLSFEGWVRGEVRFESVEELVAAMNEDVARVRRILQAG